jgi:hypothetical protein
MRAAQFLAIIGRGSKGSNALENTEDRAGATSEQQDNVINTVNSLDPYGPSWQLVPGNVAAGTVYAQVPTSGTGDLTFTRASTATRTNSAGNIVDVASGVGRIHYRNADGSLSSTGRLLLEPQRTNSIRNSTMVGAVAGTPGTLPTNYTASSGTLGLTRTIVGTGTESGLTYLDVRFNGTASSTGNTRIAFEATTGIAALVGQAWSLTTYAKIVSSPNAPNSLALVITERNSAGSGLIEGTSTIVPTSSLQRFTFTRTNTAATCAFVEPLISFALTNGATYDFTIRIAAPQMELGAYATTFIPTTTAAVTRLQDTASKTGVSSLIGQTEGTIFAEVYISQLQGAVARTLIDIGSTNNRIFVGFTGEASNTIRLQIDTSVSTVRVDFRAVIASIGTIKVAAAYKNGDCALYVNGVAGTQIVNTSFSFTTLASLVLGQTISGTAFLNDSIAQAALFPTRLTNAQLAQLTTL